MSYQDFHKLFYYELADLYDAEHQIIIAMPKMIRAAHSKELKEALLEHLEETREQVNRLERVFELMETNPTEEECFGMKGIIDECEETLSMSKSLVRDVAIISGAQKIEHYEITSYGSAISHAKFLKLDEQIINLLDANLSEEGNANKKLTKLAEGSFFSDGLNKIACES